VPDVGWQAEQGVGPGRQPARDAHAAPQVRGEGAVGGHAGRAAGLDVGEELRRDGVHAGHVGPGPPAEEPRGVDEVVRGRARRAPRPQQGPVVERRLRPARLRDLEAACHPGPRLHELERADAVHGRVVDGRAEHHAAALEERHLQQARSPGTTYNQSLRFELHACLHMMINYLINTWNI